MRSGGIVGFRTFPKHNNPPVTIVTAFGPGRKYSIAPRFGYQQHTVLFA